MTSSLKKKILHILKLGNTQKNYEIDSFSILILVSQLENEYNIELSLDDFDVKKANKIDYLTNYFQDKIKDGMGKNI